MISRRLGIASLAALALTGSLFASEPTPVRGPEQLAETIADLRAMGETAAFAERAPRTLSKRILGRMIEIYRASYADPDRRVRATFEIGGVTYNPNRL